MKYGGLKLFMKMYDGTKICKINEPPNSFEETKFFKTSQDDINYFSQIED